MSTDARTQAQDAAQEHETPAPTPVCPSSDEGAIPPKAATLSQKKSPISTSEALAAARQRWSEGSATKADVAMCEAFAAHAEMPHFERLPDGSLYLGNPCISKLLALECELPKSGFRCCGGMHEHAPGCVLSRSPWADELDALEKVTLRTGVLVDLPGVRIVEDSPEIHGGESLRWHDSVRAEQKPVGAAPSAKRAEALSGPTSFHNRPREFGASVALETAAAKLQSAAAISPIVGGWNHGEVEGETESEGASRAGREVCGSGSERAEVGCKEPGCSGGCGRQEEVRPGQNGVDGEARPHAHLSPAPALPVVIPIVPNPADLRRRIGRFRVTRGVATHHPDQLMAVMAQCAVVRAEEKFVEEEIEYLAMSPQFDVVEPGSIAPRYRWILTVNDGRLTNLRAERIPD